MGLAPQDGRAKWAAITSETAAQVVVALRSVPVIAALEGSWYHLPGSGALIRFEGVALYLLERAQEMSPELIAKDLMRLAIERSVTLTEVRLIAGIRPARVVDLGDGFSLVPPEHAPKPDFATLLFSEANQPSHGWGSPPTGAIVRRSNYALELQPPPEPGMPSPGQPVTVTAERDWNAALIACALASDGAPEFRQQYNLIDDPGWIGMQCNGIGGSVSFPRPEKQASFFKDEEVAQLFLKLRRENKTIDLAVSRLISSRRRLSHEECALDLGTCIEVLLMSGAKDNSEISYKIATRAAWLVGKGPADRLRCYEAARHLYSDRSTAAHRGFFKIPASMDEMNERIRRLRASDALCVEIITEFLNRGVPKQEDWASVVLDLPG